MIHTSIIIIKLIIPSLAIYIIIPSDPHIEKMATCPVRFDFLTDLLGKLTYIHPLPRSLVTAATSNLLLHDEKQREKFVNAIQPFMLEHEGTCLVASDKTCQSCGLPTTKILQTPMSYLHIVNDPFVSVLVSSVCNKIQCELRTRQDIQDLMSGNKTDAGTEVEEAKDVVPKEMIACKVCGKLNTMRCGRCKVVAYCGKEHQKADWAAHKVVCSSVAR